MTPCWYHWNNDWSKLCMPYWIDPSAIRSGMLSCLLRSRMLSATAAVLISTSAAGTRPLPSLRGTRRSEMTACSAVDRRWRISSCWCGGKNEITRLIVCVVSVVCSVEKTRWPVSAALSAVSSVSWSRISPISKTSGSWRSTCRSAELNDSVSFPTSRCELLDRLSRCRNSIGSSILMMRKRPTPGTPIAKSAFLCSANSLTWRGVMICSASDFSSSGLSGCWFRPSNPPFTRMVAGRPTLSSRSDPLRRTISLIAALKLKDAPAGGACSAIGVYPVKDLPELDGLRVLDTDFPDHAVQLRFDLVHDLHRFDDADDLARRDAAADFDVRLGPGLGRRIERPHHRRLDLEQLARRGGGGRGPFPHPPSPIARTGDGQGGMAGHLGDDHVVGVMPRLGHPHRGPDAEQPAPDLDRADFGRILQDLDQPGDDIEVHE